MEQYFRITAVNNPENFLEFEIRKFSSSRSKKNFRSRGTSHDK